MELVVQDKEDNTLYETSLAVGVEAGTIAIALPETVTLPVGEPYWTMALFCDPQRPASSVFVSGTIERGQRAWAGTANRGDSAISQAQAYANAGIWHDALTVLAELQQMDKRDLESQAAWVALLEQVGLAQAAAKPVQSCCKAE